MLVNETNLVQLMQDLSNATGQFGLPGETKLRYHYIVQRNGVRWFRVNLTRRQRYNLHHKLTGMPAINQTLENAYHAR